MGRKKKKPQKPWCWYCNREFEDEKILIQHQKAKHFKCHICNKKLYTGPGLAIHCMQVHKESIDKIPGALPGRDNVSIEVYGMEGLPPESVRGNVEDEPPSKIPRPAGPSIPLPGMMPPMPMMPPGPMQPFVRSAMPFGMVPQGFPPRPPPGAMPPQQMAAAMMAMGGAIRMPPMPPGPSATAIMPPSAAAAGIPMPPQMAFAAYQDKEGNRVEDSKEPPGQMPSSSSASMMSKMAGAKTRIVCPDELSSLEELMALRIVPTYTRGLLPFVR